MMRITRSQTMTPTVHVRVPVRWSTEKDCFVIVADRFKLGPNDRLEPHPHDLQMEADSDCGLHLTIGATLVKQS